MKIGVIGAKGLPPKQGGVEHHCAEIYTRLVAQGHSVDLFARSSYTDCPWLYNYEFQGVRVVCLPCLHLRGLDAFISSALGAIASCETHYDIIHFHALGPAVFSWLPKIASNSRVVVTCHGLDWQRAKWGKLSKGLIRIGESAAVRFAHGLIVVSQQLQSYFLQTYGRETVYIPNAPASYAESDPNFSYGTKLGLVHGRYILFLGRLVPEKRPDLLIEAFQTLKLAGWKLVIAGGVSDTTWFTSKLLKMAAGCTDLIFTGELLGNRLAEIVRGAGLFVLPSDFEGLPLAMLEAMLEGIPVLASDIPAHQQLMSGGRGMLFQTGDLDSCVRGLDWALHHPTQLAAMAHQAQRYVQVNHNWDHIATETLRLYTTLSDSVDPLTTRVHHSGIPSEASRSSAQSIDKHYTDITP